MSRIVLTAMNSAARYWGLRALEYYLSKKPDIYGEFTHAQIQSLAITMKFREGVNRNYKPGRKTRFVFITGAIGGKDFFVHCELQEQQGSGMAKPEWFLLRFEGGVHNQTFAVLVNRFEEEGCPQPVLPY